MTFDVGSLGDIMPARKQKIVRVTHIDGKLPNLALMKLSHWHKSQGDDVRFTKSLSRELFEPAYDIVYGSTIFGFAKKNTDYFKSQFPDAIIGGTGSDAPPSYTVEEHLGLSEYEHYDYSIYPDFQGSLGFTERGCRLKCPFCVVPKKEGKPRSVNTIEQIWRGDSYPRHIHLLDNDFFGGPEWRNRVKEIINGGFKVCFNQGINIRLITDESAECLATLPVYDDQFREKRLYTAWDNLKDEGIFMKGVERLRSHGFSPSNLLVYMLIGFDPEETIERIEYRFNAMVALGCKPYPMVFNNQNKELRRFQRWAVVGAHKKCAFKDYDQAAHDRERRNPTPNSEPFTFARESMDAVMVA